LRVNVPFPPRADLVSAPGKVRKGAILSIRRSPDQRQEGANY
jgi:hypothetical protein